MTSGWRRVKSDGRTGLRNRFDMEWSALHGGGVGPRSGAATTCAEVADLVDQLAAKFGRVDDAAGFWFGDIVGRTERQCLEARFGIVAGESRGHDDDEVAVLLKQQGQSREPIEHRHLDIEHHDVRLDAGELIDGFAPGAQRAHDLDAGFLVKPAGDKSAHYDTVVDHHDADRRLRAGMVGRC